MKATGQTARRWGRVQSRFDDPASIDGALLDSEGRVEGLVTLALVEHLLSDEAAAPPAPAADGSSPQIEPSSQGAR